MEKRIALVGIIVENLDMSEKVNAVLHDFGKYIVGRMGIPYRERGISIITVVIDAELDVINSLSGKLGKIDGISVRTQYTKTKE